MLVEIQSCKVSTKKGMIENAFSCVYDHIKSDVIQKGLVIKLTDLKKLYNDNLPQSDDEVTDKITGYNLRLKIQSCPYLKDNIDFSSSKFKETLVFCSSSESMKTPVRS